LFKLSFSLRRKRMKPFMTKEEQVSPGWTRAERKTTFFPEKMKGRQGPVSSGKI
jgi:hypothetical protein